jgi:hypothetical protein
MQIVDRYLQEVKRYLPAAQQDDILKELSANILSEMDDREAALGRPLSDDEQIAILQQQGSPMVVASRHRQEQRTFTFGRVIIGSALFPLYTKILTLNLSITVVVSTIVMTTLGVRVGLSALLLPALLQFATVTIIFAAIEQSQGKFHILDRWNPRTLPPVRDPLKISRANTVFEMFFSLVFVLCWLHVPGATYAVAYLFLGPAVRYLEPTSVDPLVYSPAWQIFYLPILVFVLLALAQHGLNFAFPRWTRNRLIARVSLSFLGLLLTFFLFRAGDLFLVNPEATNAARYVGLATLVNAVVHYSVLAGAVITLGDIVWQIRRIVRLTPAPSPASSASLVC